MVASHAREGGSRRSTADPQGALRRPEGVDIGAGPGHASPRRDPRATGHANVYEKRKEACASRRTAFQTSKRTVEEVLVRHNCPPPRPSSRSQSQRSVTKVASHGWERRNRSRTQAHGFDGRASSAAAGVLQHRTPRDESVRDACGRETESKPTGTPTDQELDLASQMELLHRR